MHLHAGLLCSTLHVPYWVQVPRKSLMNGLLLFLTQLPTFQSTGWRWCIASSKLSPVSRFHSLEQNPAQYHERSAALDMSILFVRWAWKTYDGRNPAPGMYKTLYVCGIDYQSTGDRRISEPSTVSSNASQRPMDSSWVDVTSATNLALPCT